MLFIVPLESYVHQTVMGDNKLINFTLKVTGSTEIARLGILFGLLVSQRGHPTRQTDTIDLMICNSGILLYRVTR